MCRHGGVPGVEPVAAELERRALADPEPDDVAVELAGCLDVVAEHEHVLHLGDSHVGLTTADTGAPFPVGAPRNRYAEWSSSGFSRSSLAGPS